MLFLQPQDYYLNPTGQLCMSLKGFSLVFYTSDRCAICKKLKPQFNRLSDTIQGCTFAYMDVDQESMKIRKIAAHAGTPIDYVPIFALYSDGVPAALFEFNDKTENFGNNLRQWLIQMTTKFVNSSPKVQTSQQGQQQQFQDQACPTSIGRAKPCERRNASYKSYDSAYTA